MAALAPAAAPAASRVAAPDPLARWLERARQQLAAGRLVEPAGDNALESYRAAMEIEPWNAEARRGLDGLALRQVRLAETAESRGDWIGAVEHLETAQAIAPDHPDVKALQETRRLAAVAVGPQEPARPAVAEAAVVVAAPPALPTAAPPPRAAPARARAAPAVAAVRTPRRAPSGPLDLALLDSADRLQAALARGADPDTAYDGQRRPLTIAAERRRPDVVSVLLRNGADPNVQTRDSATPLMYAAWNGDLVTATFLLEAGARTDMENRDGKTPLMAAAARGHAALAELLLRNGAEPDARNLRGWTALMYAAWGGHRDVVRLLLAQGADSAIRNDDGHTAAVLAEMRDRPALARLMTTPGAPR
jgi:ankyrin repeat protein